MLACQMTHWNWSESFSESMILWLRWITIRVGYFFPPLLHINPSSTAARTGKWNNVGSSVKLDCIILELYPNSQSTKKQNTVGHYNHTTIIIWVIVIPCISTECDYNLINTFFKLQVPVIIQRQ